MRELSESLKHKIAIHIKNGIDISDLIDGVDIRNANLSYAIISRINRVNDNITGCNFAYATIGDPTSITNLCGTNLSNCNFYRAKFIGVTWFRRSIARKCNFTSCDLSKLDYAYCDFRDSTFCHAIIKIGSKEGYKCKFGKHFFDELTRYWDIDGLVEKSTEDLMKLSEEQNGN